MNPLHIKKDSPEPSPSCSRPLHVKRIEKALDLQIFLSQYAGNNNATDESDPGTEDDSQGTSDDNAVKLDILLNDADTQYNREFYNTASLTGSRAWLGDVLQEDSSDSDDYNPEEHYLELLKEHARRKRIVKNKNVNQSIYFGAGVLSNFDKYCEQKKVSVPKTFKRKIIKEEVSDNKSTFYPLETPGYVSDEPCVDLNLESGIDVQTFDEDSNVNSDVISTSVNSNPTPLTNNTSIKKRNRKFKDEESRKKWEDIMTTKRRKVFTSIVKKEVGKQHRAKINKHKELLIQCKRVALQCQKAARQKALQSARAVKEQLWRMKRLARENLAYWKRSKRVDREIRRKMEKEAEEQRKMDFELIEAKRQQRKLNFLITQTELYAHFMSKKIGAGSTEEQLRILSQLDEEKNPRLSSIDDYDSETMKAKARRNAQEAFQNERARTKHFDMEANASVEQSNSKIPVTIDGEHPQPSIFRGILKGYQLRGMNWLANLYDQGISGILADEMGLGKTVQSIAFLCHVAEKYSVWGPFLIISPASTLHNWQQEIAKFVPDFKVIPYWGNPHERKILRQFWVPKDMHTKKASFHVVITSYQIVITDIKYFNRVKWQYMILDEAQAIKSTSSMRWKTLLGFSCRNRLLLSGTPIQNSMAELWALLHFIMPTLFDSHEEFNEWFSKDIESHAENKTGIDEKHLSRLHMILKPFMLRRIKKDVENELSDKIEVMVYCPLTTRQRLLYMALKQKIRIEDLLHYTVGGGDSHTVDKSFTSNLMNLVMQFRKVCNHPELFERRDAKSPIFLQPCVYRIPRLVFDFNIQFGKFLVLQKLFLLSASEDIAHSIREHFQETIFNFCHSLKLSYDDINKIFQGNIGHRWKVGFEMQQRDHLNYLHNVWSKILPATLKFDYSFKLTQHAINWSNVLKDLIFTNMSSGNRVIYTHNTHYYHSMPETVEHKKIRLKIPEETEEDILTKNSIPYEKRPPQIFNCQKTELPSFLFCVIPKVETFNPLPYCYSRRAAWRLAKHIDDCSYNSLTYFWNNIIHAGVNIQQSTLYPVIEDPIAIIRPHNGWSHITIPDKETLVTDSGKLSVLDGLLKRLKEEGHRVLIYSQMTKMIDLLEEYMWHRHHKYMRLDGSSKISERRDMVADFQARTDIFVFLLSTRAGGLGINLTAADTVIFYDSDWNPTVDQQAMDRAHRLGQTKQVTVYRLICKGSIEERILQRAREKSEIQKLVISGGNFKPDTLKPKEVVSLLLDDEEIEQKYRQKTEERKHLEDMREMDRKRKQMMAFKTVSAAQEAKKVRTENPQDGSGEETALPWVNVDSGPGSPHSDISPDDGVDGNYLDVEGESSITSKYTVYNIYGTTVKPRLPGRGAAKRGRPRGSRRIPTITRFSNHPSTTTATTTTTTSTTIPTTSGIDDIAFTSNHLNSANIIHLDVSGPSTSSGGVHGTVRRGPGRPRLKPGGPPNPGSRGTYRPRKPARPLPVPLPTDGVTNNNATTSSSYTSYLYDFPEQTDFN